jgi:hypothetical protein
MLLRTSSPCGTRRMAPSGSPSTSRMRLSPSTTSSMKACTMATRLPLRVTSSISPLMFLSASAMAKTPSPPCPSMGLMTARPPTLATNSLMRALSLSTVVRGITSGKCSA